MVKSLFPSEYRVYRVIWLKVIIVLLFIGVLISLSSGLVFLMKDINNPRKRLLYALGIRVSLATTLVALFYSMVGFKDALPDTLTPYSDGIFWATIGCFVLLPIVGWLCNVVAMHFYPLTKEKMAEIQDEVAQIKMKTMAENA